MIPDTRARREPVVLSVVVPTLNEERCIRTLLADIAMLPVPHEVIIADGGSTDDTTSIASDLGACVLDSPRGRGAQLAAGARAAIAPTLCFLHADVRLHADARAALVEIVRRAPSSPSSAHVFRFCIDGIGWRYRFIEGGAHLRMRLLKLPYGDQGLIVSREDYDAAGGYQNVPLMEDVALIDALRRVTRLTLLRASLPVSARRWERDGPITRMLRNAATIVAYRLGASPQRLAKHYPVVSDSPVREALPASHG